MKNSSYRSKESRMKMRLAKLGKPRSGNPLKWRHSESTKLKLSRTWFKKGRTLDQIGDKNPNWKGGTSTLDKLIRNSIHYKNWRRIVFMRDDYTCQECQARGIEIHADHIKALSLIIKENKITTIFEALNCQEVWDTNNGRTLCIPCHKNTPTYARNLKD